MSTENVVEIEEIVGEPCEEGVNNFDICADTSSMWMVTGAAAVGTIAATLIIEGVRAVPKAAHWAKNKWTEVVTAAKKKKNNKQDKDDSDDATK